LELEIVSLESKIEQLAHLVRQQSEPGATKEDIAARIDSLEKCEQEMDKMFSETTLDLSTTNLEAKQEEVL